MSFFSFGGTTECTGAEMCRFGAGYVHLVLLSSTLVVFICLVAALSFWRRIAHFGAHLTSGAGSIHFGASLIGSHQLMNRIFSAEARKINWEWHISVGGTW